MPVEYWCPYGTSSDSEIENFKVWKQNLRSTDIQMYALKGKSYSRQQCSAFQSSMLKGLLGDNVVRDGMFAKLINLS